MDKIFSTQSNLVILTGAGISAESGLQTFRASDGMWNDHRVEEVATPEAFFNNPVLVNEFYNMRRQELQRVEPNASHLALAQLEEIWEGEFLLITQNVDNLHERAGNKNILHMHGELNKARCIHTGHVTEWHGNIDENARCECCNDFGSLRPHIVWFGEVPFDMDRIIPRLQSADIFVAIGTSGQVYPAADFVNIAKSNGCTHTIEVNLEDTGSGFDDGFYGLASDKVPLLVQQLIHSVSSANDNS